VWGTRLHPLVHGVDGRFIPTCVGNTILPGACCVLTAVHPHVCGEHPDPSHLANRQFGSSPRVWGTHGVQLRSRMYNRFIPTCVGNTARLRKKARGDPVHPHVCGEHSSSVNLSDRAVGSSPRVWGTLENHRSLPRTCRFIPTCVGNTRFSRKISTRASVHPHVCGEHKALPHKPPVSLGSSPRVWGTLDAGGCAAAYRRFIPTCVGNTVITTRIECCITVHPHVCGEHVIGYWLLVLIIGSSPRVWGTPMWLNLVNGMFRFIPTCVGNTYPVIPPFVPLSVHPHVCGEHPGRPTPSRPRSGSSPRVWGTLKWSLQGLERVRFIPTCVGNTWT